MNKISLKFIIKIELITFLLIVFWSSFSAKDLSQVDLANSSFKASELSNNTICCITDIMDFFDVEGLTHYRHHGHFDFTIVAEIFVILMILSLKFFDNFENILSLQINLKERPPTS